MALTKYNYNSFDVTPVASKALGFNSGANGLTSISPTSMVLIKTITASTGDATISFVDGTSDVVLDNTYPVYLFKWINVHPSNDGWALQFQGNAAGGSGYNETITSTHFKAQHTENDTSTSLAYVTALDQAQGTGFQYIASDLGNDADQSSCGELWLFNPSSTTYTTRFLAKCTEAGSTNFNVSSYVSGHFNTTSAIDEIQFKMSGNDIDAGTFKLYGIKDS